MSRGSPSASSHTPGHDRWFPGMLFSPVILSEPGKPSDPEIYLQSLPAARKYSVNLWDLDSHSVAELRKRPTAPRDDRIFTPAGTEDPREVPVSRLPARPGVAPGRFPFPTVKVFLLLSPPSRRSYPQVTAVIHRLMHSSSTGYAT